MRTTVIGWAFIILTLGLLFSMTMPGVDLICHFYDSSFCKIENATIIAGHH